MTTRYSLISRTIEDVYGVGCLTADCAPIEGAFDRLVTSHGYDIAVKQLRALNRRRERTGRRPCYEPLLRPGTYFSAA